MSIENLYGMSKEDFNKLTLKEKYYKYLLLAEWRTISKNLKDLYEKCYYCKNIDDLIVHHITYDNVSYEVIGSELFSDVVVLCRTCHERSHQGESVEIIVATNEDRKHLVEILGKSTLGYSNYVSMFFITPQTNVRLYEYFASNYTRTSCKSFLKPSALTSRSIEISRKDKASLRSYKIGSDTFVSHLVGDTLESITGHDIIRFYFKGKGLCEDMVITDICKLVYLSTFIEYGTNRLLLNGNLICRNDIQEIMGVTKIACYAWFDKMIKLGYVIEHEGGYKINESFTSKDITYSGKNINDSVFASVENVREFYLSLKQSEHYLMGVVFQMVNYIEPQRNCLKHYGSYSTDCYGREYGNLGNFITYERVAKVLQCRLHECNRLENKILDTWFGKEQIKLATHIEASGFEKKIHSLKNNYEESRVIMFNPQLFYKGHLEKYSDAVEMFSNAMATTTKTKGGVERTTQ